MFKLDAKGKGVVQCPICQIDHPFLNRGELDKIAKNFALISDVGQLKTKEKVT